MRNILLLFTFIPLWFFSQTTNDSLEIGYKKISERYEDTYNIYKQYIKYDSDIENRIKGLEKFKVTYEKLLKLDDLNNKNVQKAILSDFFSQYGYIFKIKAREKNILIYGLDNKQDISFYINNTYHLVKSDIEERMFLLIEKIFEKADLYLNENLNRLGISRKDYDAMSENDQKAILTTLK